MKSKRLFNKDIILIDKNNKDYSELEKALDNYNKSGRAKPKNIKLMADYLLDFD